MTDKVLDHVDEALGRTNSPEEVHVHKEHFEKMKQDCDARSHGAISSRDPATTPVVEGSLGSTKQLGDYASPGRKPIPVYSHGKGKDVIHVRGKTYNGGNSGDWFREGKKLT